MIQNASLLHTNNQNNTAYSVPTTKITKREVQSNTQSRLHNNKRTYVRGLALISLLIAAVVLLSSFLSLGQQDVYASSVQEQASYKMVSSGETLWEIAANNAPEGQSIRSYMAKIKELNQLKDSTLKVGQKLLLP